nr:MAG TPA: hypothetical protein [Bacteriophage sp.]DAI57845.1 MAG TPA: hypothetical protein [Caudoviricetes sp.]
MTTQINFIKVTLEGLMIKVENVITRTLNQDYNI